MGINDELMDISLNIAIKHGLSETDFDLLRVIIPAIIEGMYNA